MKRLALALVIVGILLIVTAPAEAVPPRPEQPRPDLFSCGTFTCDRYNPVTIKAKQTRTVAYRVVVEPGCTAGIIPQELARMNAHVIDSVRLNLARNDAAPDFTVHINCGSEQIRLCGSVNTYCLNRGYPYVADVDISDVLSTYFPESRLSILLHEILGHAVGSWNEQYATCGASCNFAASQGWRDFMNTGPDSRHGIEAIEFERWERTMFPVVADCGGAGDPYWDACVSRWRFSNGWSWEPSTGVWWNPQDKPEFTACNQDRLRWNIQVAVWVPERQGFFDPQRGFWSFAGAC